MSYYRDNYKGKRATRCYESHPLLPLSNGQVMGASCVNPEDGYDIYVGFDWGMQRIGKDYPWESKKGPIEFLFRIQDMCAPTSSDDFKKLIDWLESMLDAGKKIHIGCIGGHGRTGTVLSALVNQILKIEDSTTWVRENYCEKAVESKSQEEFLHKHYGITRVGATKGKHSNKKSTVTKMNLSSPRNGGEVIPHIESNFCIW